MNDPCDTEASHLPTSASYATVLQVVTAFVQRPTDGSVLVVLRSDKVGTYQRYWGAVSGGVEQGDRSLADRCRQEVCKPVPRMFGKLKRYSARYELTYCLVRLNGSPTPLCRRCGHTDLGGGGLYGGPSASSSQRPPTDCG